MVGNRAFNVVPAGRRGTRDLPAGGPLPDVPLGLPTLTFRNATTAPGGMIILSEAGEAGAIFELTVPAAADSLTFSYEFSTPGDGDFLSVEIEGQGRVASGLDDEAGREGFATSTISLRGYEEKPIQLIFRLVSRGAANAVLELSALRIQQTDDSDGDGLINSAEIAASTDPRNSDTDFDGLSDGDEINFYQTSPLAGDTDGDGAGDRSEVTAGTDPLQNGSFLRGTGESRISG